jgi:hypothetical protein
MNNISKSKLIKVSVSIIVAIVAFGTLPKRLTKKLE